MRVIPAVAALLLSACNTLPTSGPTEREIMNEAEAAAAIGYTIVDLDPDIVASLEEPDVTGAIAALTASSPAAAAQIGRIAPGDSVEITLFEVGASLFGGETLAGGFDPSARSRSLGVFLVQPDGSVAVPFAGRIDVSGLSPVEAAERIERGFAGLSQQPQVQVRFADNRSDTVLFSGAVNQQGRLALSAAPETLTEALALRGGPAGPPEQLTLRFRRDGRTAELPLEALMVGGGDDIRLRPGDRIEIVPHQRSILAYGAMNAVREIPFETATVSLAEAIARAGGPSDVRADPSAVFVFRDDPEQPVIYRLNLLRPSGYFLAQRFPMRDKDLIYVANSAANQPSKLIDIINRLFQPLFTIEQLTN